MLYRPDSRLTWIYFLSNLVVAFLLIGIEGGLTGLLLSGPRAAPLSLPSAFGVRLTLLITTCLYRQVLAYDTLAQQNVIQAGGLSLSYGIQCVFIGVQYSSVEFTPETAHLDRNKDLDSFSRARIRLSKKLMLSLIIILPVWTLFSIFLVWRLQREMAWKTFRKMDADLVMQHKFRTFQVLVTFLKFDAMYTLEHLVQVIMAVSAAREHPLGNVNRWVIPLLGTVIPASFILFLTTAYCVRHEHTMRTFILMGFHVTLFILIGWFISFLTTIKARGPISGSLSMSFYWASISTATLIFCTLCVTAMCYRNFNHGLKPYISGGKMATLLEENFELETLRNDSSTSAIEDA